MRYLLRAALRAETAAPAARPAIPSRSPLAAVDQRLNIDSFASQFDLPLVNERDAAPFDADEPGLLPSDEGGTAPSRSREARGQDAGRTPPTSRPPERDGRRGATPETTPRAPSEQARPAPLPSTSDASAAGHADGAGLGEAGTSTAAGRADALRPPEAPPPPGRRVNALPDPSAEGGRAPSRGPEAPGGLSPQRSKPPTAADSAAESMLEALSRAMSWVEGGGGRAGEAGRAGEQSARPAPRARPDEAASWPLRATPRDTRPVTHLEIGKIEVEVVAPARPAPAPPRQAPGGGRPGGVPRRSFGWRQR